MCLAGASSAQDIGQAYRSVPGDQKVGRVPALYFLVELLRAYEQTGLAAAFHVHDRSYVQGKMEQFLGKGIGFDGILAVQEENVAFAVHGYGRDGIEGTAGGPEYAALGIDDAVVLHHQAVMGEQVAGLWFFNSLRAAR